MAITCDEFDSLKLTCDEYDSMTLDKLKALVSIRLDLFNAIKDDTPLTDKAIETVQEIVALYPDVAKSTLSNDNLSNKKAINYFITLCIGLFTNPNALIFWAQKLKELIDYLS